MQNNVARQCDEEESFTEELYEKFHECIDTFEIAVIV